MRTDPRIEQCGFTQSPLGQAASEVDRLRGQIAHLQDALETIERTVGFVAKDEPLAVWVERAVKERDKARAACAEMREVLTKAWRDILEWEQLATNHRKALGDAADFTPYCPTSRAIAVSETLRNRIGKALSTDCGRGWLSPEVGRELNELLDYIDRHVLDEYIVQGDCSCGDDPPCGYCASVHARDAIRKRAKEAGV